MATSARIGYVGTEAIGDVLTKTNWDRTPGGMVASLSLTSNSAATGATATILTLAVPTGISRRYRITIHCSSITTAGALGPTNINIFDSTGAAQLASLVLAVSGGGPGNYEGGTLSVDHQPASGTNTYLFRTTTSNTTAQVNASATTPAQIFVHDLGPSY